MLFVTMAVSAIMVAMMVVLSILDRVTTAMGVVASQPAEYCALVMSMVSMSIVVLAEQLSCQQTRV